MPEYLTEAQLAVLEAACEALIPAVDGHPGAKALGVAHYIDGALGAFSVDPPRIFAGGPFSGRFGGEPGFSTFTGLTRFQELAWRTRIEGSAGIPEREINGPVVGWQQIYTEGLAGLGADFLERDPPEQLRRIQADTVLFPVLWAHCGEGAYGAPEYGGNRDMLGWQAIQYPGDIQPRGFTDAEVSGP
jgi:hypothetical protein